jgi:general secretion pathway protein N
MAPAGARELRGNPLWAIPLKSLSFTRDRPLFTPSRRPPVPPVPAAEPVRQVVVAKPAEPERPQLLLIGVVVSEKDGIAIFVDQTTREVFRLRIDQGHGGWILRSVHGREATLEKSPFTVTLALPAPGDQPRPTVPFAGPNGIIPNQGDQL